MVGVWIAITGGRSGGWNSAVCCYVIICTDAHRRERQGYCTTTTTRASCTRVAVEAMGSAAAVAASVTELMVYVGSYSFV